MLSEGANICCPEGLFELDDPTWSAFVCISSTVNVGLTTDHRRILKEPRVMLVGWLHLEPRD